MPGVFPPASMKKAGKGFFTDDYWSLVRVRLRFQISRFQFRAFSSNFSVLISQFSLSSACDCLCSLSIAEVYITLSAIYSPSLLFAHLLNLPCRAGFGLYLRG